MLNNRNQQQISRVHCSSPAVRKEFQGFRQRLVDGRVEGQGLPEFDAPLAQLALDVIHDQVDRHLQKKFNLKNYYKNKSCPLTDKFIWFSYMSRFDY